MLPSEQLIELRILYLLVKGFCLPKRTALSHARLPAILLPINLIVDGPGETASALLTPNSRGGAI